MGGGRGGNRISMQSYKRGSGKSSLQAEREPLGSCIFMRGLLRGEQGMGAPIQAGITEDSHLSRKLRTYWKSSSQRQPIA